jgi:peptidoglycan/LPS O-acetylase OafA/YrhL
MRRTEADMKKYIPLILLDCAAFAVIAYTVWLGNHDSWTTSNLSVIGYWRGYSGYLVGWGWLCGVVFVAYLLYLAHIYSLKSGLMQVFTMLAGLFLVVGVYLPYQPGTYPILSNVHIAAALLAPFFVVGAIICILIRLSKRKMPGARVLIIAMVLLLGGAAVIFIRCTIITTLLEVYTVSVLTAYMTVLALLGLNGYKK